jgi:hypothetical protein
MLRQLAPAVKEFDRGGAKIELDPPVIPDNPARLTRGTLDEVLRHVNGHRSSIDDAFHQDARRILDVHLQTTQMAAKRKDTPRREQPVDIVQFVAVRQTTPPRSARAAYVSR